MISVDEALVQYAQRIRPLASEPVLVERALGRVLRTDIQAGIDLPPFTQSAMDGFAVRATDTAEACPDHPVALRLVETIAAGAGSPGPLGPRQAARIFTGAPVPGGADAVVRQEKVRLAGEEIVLVEPAVVGEDTRTRGEETRRGELLARAGCRMHAGAMAALAGAGVDQLLVSRRPRVACLVTGDELVRVGAALRGGQVYDVNGLLVGAWLHESMVDVVHVRRVRDDLSETAAQLVESLDVADLVITTGGVSVGERDYVIEAARSLDVDQVFWRVRQRPGKPLFFGMRGHSAMIGLPGNPGSVFAGLVVHVRRVLELMEGVQSPAPHFHSGVLEQPIPASPEREAWVRCRVLQGIDGRTRLVALPRQASHMISNLLDCSALARIPAQAGEMPAGVSVDYVAC